MYGKIKHYECDLDLRELVVAFVEEGHSQAEAARQFKLHTGTVSRMLFLPLYSPDLNLIEHLWANLKRKLRLILHKFPSLQAALQTCFS